jgi:septal ring factor EnvC (AmiA/AmiB activator)
MPDPLPQDGVPIQSMGDLKKLPVETLIEKLMQANRALQEEKRQSARKESETRNFIKIECDRLRNATSQHLRDLEDQNSTLLKSLTRLQIENDKCRHEITTLQVKLEAALTDRPEAPQETAHAGRALAPTPDGMHAGAPLAMPPASPALTGDPIPPKLPAPQSVPVVIQALPQ